MMLNLLPPLRIPFRTRRTMLRRHAGRVAAWCECPRGWPALQFIVVEAAGVEPASENVTGQETTCLFRFMPQALGALRRFPRDVRSPRSERTRNASR